MCFRCGHVTACPTFRALKRSSEGGEAARETEHVRMRHRTVRAVAVGLLLGALMPGAVTTRAAVATRDVLLVGNSGDGTVDFFDANTYAKLGTLNVIPDGATPRNALQAAAYPALVKTQGVNFAQDIQLSPDGATLYVSRGYLGDVAAFSLRTHKLLWRTEIQSFRADHAELSPDGSRLFVSAITSDLVEVLDTHTHKLIGAVPAGDFPHTLGFSPDGRTVYGGSLGIQPLDALLPVTPPADGRHWLEAIDPKTMRLKRLPCELPAGIRPFALTADGRTMYVQLSYFNGIVKYDPVHCKTLARFALPLEGRALTTAPHDYPNQAAQHGVALSPDEHLLCLAETIDDRVALVRAPHLALDTTIAVGTEPGYAVNSPDGSRCFVSSRGADANTVSVISYATESLVAIMHTGLHPQVEITARIPVDVLAAGGFA